MTRAETLARLAETIRNSTTYGLRVTNAFAACASPVFWSARDVEIVACDAQNAGHFGNLAVDCLDRLEQQAVTQALADAARW